MTGKTLIKGAGVLVLAVALGGSIAMARDGQGGGFGGPRGPAIEFETLDADGDGNVTVAEMRAHATGQFSERDTDGDGVLSADELVAAANDRAAEMVSRMIEWRDVDGDGALSQAEMGGNTGMRIFQRMDADEDGMISAEEFEQAGAGGRGDGGGFGKRRGHGDMRRGG